MYITVSTSVLFVSVGIEYELESVTGRLEERGTEEELAQVEDLKKTLVRSPRDGGSGKATLFDQGKGKAKDEELRR
jgi:hypothetical protein